ncbi:MAG: hypothetical protein RBR09_01800 [Desulfobulbaceae bacterium]|jgi:hypothetical protein|nr:hypothetical protein [Desulfobulbaceae bacterium]MDY0349963.1 hypothetical protein [Desulfobulbaceae bacterium]
MEYKKAIIIIRNKDYALDGMRSALGLAVENMYSYAHLLDTEIDKLDDNNQDRLEMLRDMEGEVYSNVQANVDNNGLELMSIEELGEKLREMNVIVPYGII